VHYVADYRNLKPGYAAFALAYGESVKKRLRWMLVSAVARVDD
jgi:hypothetical protein